MIARWQTAPWWVVSLVAGAVFGGWMTLVFHHQGGSWDAALAGGALGGVLFGAVMGPFVTRVRRREWAVTGGDRAAHRRAAAALRRGPLPDDVVVRDVALRLGTVRLERLHRQQRDTTILFTIFIALYVVLAVTTSPLWWFGAAIFLAFLWLVRWQPRRLRRRLEALARARSGVPSPPPD